MFTRCEHLGTKQIDCPYGVMEGREMKAEEPGEGAESNGSY